MRKLETHFTTTEQSERLLALGLPADTADCYYEMAYRPILQLLPEGISFSQLPQYIDDEDGDTDEIPCWSVGRLIEIAEIMVGSDTWQDYQQPSKEKPTLAERAVCTIENLCNLLKFDFSKLFE